MAITFEVNGQAMTFSEKELSFILEEYFAYKSRSKELIEEEWFEVKPQEINQTLFEEERKDRKQELTRRRILWAFEVMKNYPEKYGKNFKTLMPKKNWIKMNIPEFKQMSAEIGDHMADKVEQYLEWAMRIFNGETWEKLCNIPDNAHNFRLIVWDEKGNVISVGGRRRGAYPPTFTHENYIYYDYELPNISGEYVPLIVSYD